MTLTALWHVWGPRLPNIVIGLLAVVALIEALWIRSVNRWMRRHAAEWAAWVKDHDDQPTTAPQPVTRVATNPAIAVTVVRADETPTPQTPEPATRLITFPRKPPRKPTVQDVEWDGTGRRPRVVSASDVVARYRREHGDPR